MRPGDGSERYSRYSRDDCDVHNSDDVLRFVRRYGGLLAAFRGS